MSDNVLSAGGEMERIVQQDIFGDLSSNPTIFLEAFLSLLTQLCPGFYTTTL